MDELFLCSEVTASLPNCRLYRHPKSKVFSKLAFKSFQLGCEQIDLWNEWKDLEQMIVAMMTLRSIDSVSE
ncbi:hypothetical protein [Tunturiibacter gelidiferens]|uniref:Uncharacterized protein n=1 Tax=Tunturiibacter gelidiferens TaxID=3069689 RepID=A0AAU7Z100_9BACT